jgi:hypothetical protein
MTDPTDPAAVKPRRGCLFYGCLGGTACLLIILIAFLLGLYQLKKMLNFYTDTRPAPLPSVQMTQAEIDQLKQRIESFRDAVRSGHPTPPMSLTSDEINAFIQNDPNLARAKGKLFVTIEGDRLKGQVSLPLDDLGLSIFRGRYLNGTGTFAVSLQNGGLVVTAQSLVVKGKPLPGVYLDKIRSQNLAASLNNNTGASAGLNHLQDIRVSDGKLVLTPKAVQ